MVREWAHLRWGLFDENLRNGEPTFYTAGRIPKPTGFVNLLSLFYRLELLECMCMHMLVRDASQI